MTAYRPRLDGTVRRHWL